MGTLVAAEMLAGTTGVGFIENVARKTSDYEVIWVTILIGVLGLLLIWRCDGLSHVQSLGAAKAKAEGNGIPI